LVLRTVPGVDDVMSWGGQERQYQVQIDPRQLIAYDLDYQTVLEAIEVNNGQVGGH
jgi:cobalt-zinc-cadmium resistance protein CzcA